MPPDDSPSPPAAPERESTAIPSAEPTDNSLNAFLPRGFQYQTGIYLNRETEIIRLFLRRAELMGFMPLRIPPVGFSAIFKKGANVAEGKIFEFNDRRGRALALTADATAAILNRYCNRGQFSFDERLAYISPTFRYRRMRQRHYLQIGFAYINPNLSASDEIDYPTLLITSGLCKFVTEDLRIPLTIELNDFQLIRRQLGNVFQEESRVDNALHMMRRMDAEERRAWLTGQNVEASLVNQLLEFFSAQIEIAPDGTVSSTGTVSYLPELSSLESFSENLRKICRVPIVLRFGNFQGSEFISGIGVRLRVASGKAIGEGGNYTRYGKNFDAGIRSFGSMAVSLERLIEYADIIPASSEKPAVALLRLDATISFTCVVAENIRDAGIAVEEGLAAGKLKKKIKRASERCPWLIVLGAAEEKSGVVRLKHLPSRTEYSIAVNDLGEHLAEMLTTR